jgi:hypothetical protein
MTKDSIGRKYSSLYCPQTSLHPRPHNASLPSEELKPCCLPPSPTLVGTSAGTIKYTCTHNWLHVCFKYEIILICENYRETMSCDSDIIPIPEKKKKKKEHIIGSSQQSLSNPSHSSGFFGGGGRVHFIALFHHISSYTTHCCLTIVVLRQGVSMYLRMALISFVQATLESTVHLSQHSNARNTGTHHQTQPWIFIT